jgi:hypothetical protein
VLLLLILVLPRRAPSWRIKISDNIQQQHQHGDADDDDNYNDDIDDDDDDDMKKMTKNLPRRGCWASNGRIRQDNLSIVSCWHGVVIIREVVNIILVAAPIFHSGTVPVRHTLIR